MDNILTLFRSVLFSMNMARFIELSSQIKKKALQITNIYYSEEIIENQSMSYKIYLTLQQTYILKLYPATRVKKSGTFL